jgi:hypothetical protein
MRALRQVCPGQSWGRLLTTAVLSLSIAVGAALVGAVSAVPRADAQVPPISVGTTTTVGIGVGSGIAGANVNAGVTTGSLLNGVSPLLGGVLGTAGGVLNGVLPGSGGLLNGLLPGMGGLLNGVLPAGSLYGGATVTGPLGTGASTTVTGGIP